MRIESPIRELNDIQFIRFPKSKPLSMHKVIYLDGCAFGVTHNNNVWAPGYDPRYVYNTNSDGWRIVTLLRGLLGLKVISKDSYQAVLKARTEFLDRQREQRDWEDLRLQAKELGYRLVKIKKGRK